MKLSHALIFLVHWDCTFLDGGFRDGIYRHDEAERGNEGFAENPQFVYPWISDKLRLSTTICILVLSLFCILLTLSCGCVIAHLAATGMSFKISRWYREWLLCTTLSPTHPNNLLLFYEGQGHWINVCFLSKMKLLATWLDSVTDTKWIWSKYHSQLESSIKLTRLTTISSIFCWWSSAEQVCALFFLQEQVVGTILDGDDLTADNFSTVLDILDTLTMTAGVEYLEVSLQITEDLVGNLQENPLVVTDGSAKVRMTDSGLHTVLIG